MGSSEISRVTAVAVRALCFFTVISRGQCFLARAQSPLVILLAQHRQVYQDDGICSIMSVGSKGSEGDRSDGRRWFRNRKPLGHLTSKVDACCKEMCVANEGRPLAAAMSDFVDGLVEIYLSGYAKEALELELQFQDSTTPMPGQTLTAVEKQYRTNWLLAVYMVLEDLKLVEERPIVSNEEYHLKSQVKVVMRGRRYHDELTFVKFDKALASRGRIGGAAAGQQGTEQTCLPLLAAYNANFSVLFCLLYDCSPCLK
ncbi:unnamed protein product [Choristocarpus tenellus]